MKIAIAYAGYHYNYIDSNTINGKIRNVNWRQTYHNQQLNLFQPLRDMGYNIDVYMSTYHSDLQDTMLCDLQPLKYHFNELSGRFLTDGAWGRLQNILKCIDLIESSGIGYDYVIFLRFDLALLQSIQDLNIDYQNINITFLNYDGLTYDDIFTFSIIPLSYYHRLIEYIRLPRVQKRFLNGGYCNHILKAEFEQIVCVPHLMLTEGKYKRGNGWQVNINPIYFLPSQMVDTKCYLCYNDYTHQKSSVTLCGCKYHLECYHSWNLINEGCVRCRNITCLNSTTAI
jgi:hypothetical protein